MAQTTAGNSHPDKQMTDAREKRKKVKFNKNFYTAGLLYKLWPKRDYRGQTVIFSGQEF